MRKAIIPIYVAMVLAAASFLVVLEANAKLWFAAGQVASLALLCASLGTVALVRRTSPQAAWFVLSVAFGCIALGLGVIAAHWGVPRAERPFLEVGVWLAAGAIALLAGSLLLAAHPRRPIRSRGRHGT
jgi:hypothetical protein